MLRRICTEFTKMVRRIWNFLAQNSDVPTYRCIQWSLLLAFGFALRLVSFRSCRCGAALSTSCWCGTALRNSCRCSTVFSAVSLWWNPDTHQHRYTLWHGASRLFWLLRGINTLTYLQIPNHDTLVEHVSCTHTQGVPRSQKVVKFSKTIFQPWKVTENNVGHESRRKWLQSHRIFITIWTNY